MSSTVTELQRIVASDGLGRGVVAEDRLDLVSQYIWHPAEPHRPGVQIFPGGAEI